MSMNTDIAIFNVSIGGRLSVCPDDVIMLQAKANYSMVYLADGQQLFVATTLKKLQERLSSFSFIRVNRAYLVNSNYVIEEYENSLKLTNALTITFSRRKGKKWKEKKSYAS